MSQRRLPSSDASSSFGVRLRPSKSSSYHFPQNGAASNGFSPGLRTVEEGRPSVAYQRGLSEASTKRAERERRVVRDEREQHAQSESSSDDSAPTIFDLSATNAAGITSPDSAAAEGSEDAWTELKVRLFTFLSVRHRDTDDRMRVCAFPPV
jgi:hypothetical protein